MPEKTNLPATLEKTVETLIAYLEQMSSHASPQADKPPGSLDQLVEMNRPVVEFDQVTTQLRALARTAALINSPLDLERTLQEVIDTAIRITNAERAYLMLLNDATRELEVRLARNWEAHTLPEHEITFSRQMVEAVIRQGKPILSLDAGADARFSDFRSVHLHQLKSVLCIPLLSGENVIGAIYADHRYAPAVFHAQSVWILSLFGSQAAVAIENAQLFERLRTAHAELVAAREEERRRLRNDLHDGLGPLLAGIALCADSAGRLLNTQPDRALDLLHDVQGQVQAAITEVRQVTHGLRPPALDELGLWGAIRMQAEKLEAGRLQIVLAPSEALPALSAASEVVLYRVATEAITNAVRHAQASVCKVSLSRDEGMLCLVVEDDGCGFTVVHQQGIGLNSMRERCVELGGTFEIVSSPERGTRIQVRIPIGRL